jgi:hypothetical protein
LCWRQTRLSGLIQLLLPPHLVAAFETHPAAVAGVC